MAANHSRDSNATQLTRRLSRACCLLLVTATAMTMAACGDDKESTSSDTGGSTTAVADGGSSGLELAQSNLDAMFTGGYFSEPPAESPDPQTGKDVWVVTFGANCESCQTWIKNIQEAGKLMQWKTRVYDGKFTPARYVDGVRQAIAAKADGIILVAVDCAAVKAPLEEARAAGIKISAIESADCNDQDPSAEPLFDATVIYNVGDKPGSFTDFQRSLGASQADLLAVNTKGKGKIIGFKNTDAFVSVLEWDGMIAELEKVCPDCEIVDQVDFIIADLAGRLRQKVEQSILRNPDAEAMVLPFGDALIGGPSEGIAATGRDLLVVASAQTASAMELVQAGKLDAGYALATDWEAWAGVDGLNRLFAGEKAEPSGIGLAMVDKDHNVREGGYKAPVDFAAAYKKAWGVE